MFISSVAPGRRSCALLARSLPEYESCQLRWRTARDQVWSLWAIRVRCPATAIPSVTYDPAIPGHDDMPDKLGFRPSTSNGAQPR